jgi:tRNA-Thr(GGU) m(6)t(6)A37 methyltransferase TsaA
MRFEIQRIGVVRNDRSDPACSDHWAEVVSDTEIDERFGDDCMLGLEDFSHVEVLFHFDRAAQWPDYRPRRPRGREDLPLVGMFADRGPRRPNRLGVTTCRIVAVEGRTLTVAGLDAVAGTPVVDLKPTMLEFQVTGVHQPEWVGRLMSDYFRPAT